MLGSGEVLCFDGLTRPLGLYYITRHMPRAPSAVVYARPHAPKLSNRPPERPMTVAINLGGTVALRYDEGGDPVTLTGREVLGDPDFPVTDLNPVQSNAIAWSHLIELRSTLIALYAQGERRFLVLTGTDSAEDILYFLALTCPAQTRVALVVTMAASAAEGDQSTSLASALAWVQDETTPALALWCDGQRYEPPVQKLLDPQTWHFHFQEHRLPDKLPPWRVGIEATIAARMPTVPIVSVGIGSAAWICPFLESLQFDAVVVEAYAAGDVPPEVARAIVRTSRAGRPVVIASRSRPGCVIAKFPGVAGASAQVLTSGALSAAQLAPHIARIRLALSLALDPPVIPATIFALEP